MSVGPTRTGEEALAACAEVGYMLGRLVAYTHELERMLKKDDLPYCSNATCSRLVAQDWICVLCKETPHECAYCNLEQYKLCPKCQSWICADGKHCHNRGFPNLCLQCGFDQ